MIGTQRGSRLGDRLRQLRVSAGLTQSDLARERFSKEYISQIERGKTRPTRETVEWLAEQLGVDATFLESGVSSDERARAEAILARAEALAERRDYDGAVEEFTKALAPVVATGAVELHVRVLSGEAWARMHRGDVRVGIELLEQARGLVEGPSFSDLDRAEVLFRLGVSPLSDLEHRDVDRAVRRGARPQRALAPADRHAAGEDPDLALALLPAPA